MVHPLQSAFESIGNRPLEVASTLRASPLDTFITVVVPLALPGFISASIITFAHTVGEFGMILMIGGNLPGITRVASVQIYDYVESLDFASAHRLAGVMLARDVSISKNRIEQISIQNSLYGIVDAIGDDEHPGLSVVRVMVGSSCILSRLARRAVADLGLKTGEAVWVHVKLAAPVSYTGRGRR
jgi:molybdopterin-binding protein